MFLFLNALLVAALALTVFGYASFMFASALIGLCALVAALALVLTALVFQELT